MNKDRASTMAGVRYMTEDVIKKVCRQDQLELITSLNLTLSKDGGKKFKYIEHLEKLKKLQTLNLANNMVEKMENLDKLSKLRELSLAYNKLTKIEGIEGLVSLQVLNVTGNQIEHIPVWLGKKLKSLRTLKLAKNELQSLQEFTKLRPLKDLTLLTVAENPVALLPHCRAFLVFHLSTLETLDGQRIMLQERHQAANRFGQEEIEKLTKQLEDTEGKYKTLELGHNRSLNELQEREKSVRTKEEKLKEHSVTIKDMRRELDTKNDLLKKKTCELTRACEKHYELEQELAFYKIDHKFEELSRPPKPMSTDDESLLDDSGLMGGEAAYSLLDDSGLMGGEAAYVGKGRFYQNQLAREKRVRPAQGSPSQRGGGRGGGDNIGVGEDASYVDSELQASIQSRQAQITELDHELSFKQQAARDASDKLSGLQEELARTGKHLTVANEELYKLNEAHATRNLTEDNKQNIRAKLSNKIDKVHDLRDATHGIEQDLQYTEDAIRDQEQVIGNLRGQLKRLSPNDPRHEDLRREIERKESELDATNRDYYELQGQLEKMLGSIAKETGDMQRLETDLREGQVQQNDQIKNELETIISGLQTYLNDVQSKADKQKQEFEGLLGEREELLEQLKDLEGRRREAEQQAEEITLLREKLGDVEEGLVQGHDLNDLLSSRRDNTADKERSNKKLGDVEEGLAQERDLNDSLSRRLDESRAAEAEDADLTSQLHGAEGEIDRLRRDLAEADRKLQHEREDFTKALDEEKQKAGQLKRRVKGADAKDDEIQTLQKQLGELQKSNIKYQDELWGAKQRLKDDADQNIDPHTLRRRLGDVVDAIRTGKNYVEPEHSEDELGYALRDLQDDMEREMDKTAADTDRAHRDRDKAEAEARKLRDAITQAHDDERDRADRLIQDVMGEQKRETDRLRDQLQRLKAELEREKRNNRPLPKQYLQPSKASTTTSSSSATGTTVTSRSHTDGSTSSEEESTIPSSQWSNKRRELYGTFTEEEQALFDELQQEIELLRQLLAKRDKKSAEKAIQAIDAKAQKLQAMLDKRQSIGVGGTTTGATSSGEGVGGRGAERGGGEAVGGGRHKRRHSRSRSRENRGKRAGVSRGDGVDGVDGGLEAYTRGDSHSGTGRRPVEDARLHTAIKELSAAQHEIDALQDELKNKNSALRHQIKRSDKKDQTVASTHDELENLHDILEDQRGEIERLNDMVDTLSQHPTDEYRGAGYEDQVHDFLRAADNLRSRMSQQRPRMARLGPPGGQGGRGQAGGVAGGVPYAEDYYPERSDLSHRQSLGGRPVPTFYSPDGRPLAPHGYDDPSQRPHGDPSQAYYGGNPQGGAPGGQYGGAALYGQAGAGPYGQAGAAPYGQAGAPGMAPQGAGGMQQIPPQHAGVMPGLHPQLQPHPAQSLPPGSVPGGPLSAPHPLSGVEPLAGGGAGLSDAGARRGSQPEAIQGFMGPDGQLYIPADQPGAALFDPETTPHHIVRSQSTGDLHNVGFSASSTPMAGHLYPGGATPNASFIGQHPTMMSTPVTPADGSGNVRGILKKAGGTLVRSKSEENLVCNVPEHHDLEDYIEKLQNKIRRLKARNKDRGESSVHEDANRRVLFEDDVDKKTIKRLQAELEARRGELEGLDLDIEQQKQQLGSMREAEKQLLQQRQAARDELGQLRGSKGRSRRTKAFLEGTADYDGYESDYDYEYKPKGRGTRSEYLIQEVSCLEETLARRRAELREADRLLQQTELDLEAAQGEARTTIQQYDSAKQGYNSTIRDTDEIEKRAYDAGVKLIKTEEHVAAVETEFKQLQEARLQQQQLLQDVQKVISGKDQHFTALKLEICEAERRLAEVRSSLEHAEGLQEGKLALMEESERVIQHRKQEIDDYKRQIHYDKADRDSIDLELERKQAELAQLESEVRGRQEKLSGINQDMSHQVHGYRGQMQQLEGNVEAMKSQHRKFEKEIYQKQQKLKKLDDEIQNEEAILKNVTMTTHKHKNSLENVEQELQGEISQLETLQAQCKHRGIELEGVQGQIQQEEEELLCLRTESLQKTSEIDGIRLQMQREKENMESLQSQRKSLESVVEKLRGDKSGMEGEAREVQRKVHELKQAKSTLEDTISTHTVHVGRMDQQLKQIEQLLGVKGQERQGLERDLQGLRADIDDGRSELDSVTGSLRDTEGSLKHLQSEVEAIASKKSQLTHEYEALRQKCEDDYSERVVEFRAHMEDIRADNLSVETRLAEAQSELDTIHSSLASKQQQTQQLAQQIEKQQREYEFRGRTEEKFSSLENRIRNLGQEILTRDRDKEELAGALDRSFSEVQSLRQQLGRERKDTQRRIQGAEVETGSLKQELGDREQELQYFKQKATKEITDLEGIAQAHSSRANRLSDELSYLRADYMEVKRQLDSQKQLAERDREIGETIRELKSDLTYELKANVPQDPEVPSKEVRGELNAMYDQKHSLQKQVQEVRDNLYHIRRVEEQPSATTPASFAEHQELLKHQLQQRMSRQTETMQAHRQLSQSNILSLQNKLTNLEQVLSQKGNDLSNPSKTPILHPQPVRDLPQGHDLDREYSPLSQGHGVRDTVMSSQEQDRSTHRNGTYNHNQQQDDYNEEDAFITQPIKHKPDTETFFPTEFPSNSNTSHQPPTSIHQRNSINELKSATNLEANNGDTAPTTRMTSETPQKPLSSTKGPRDRTPSRIPTPTGSVGSGGIGGGGAGARLGSRDSGIMDSSPDLVAVSHIPRPRHAYSPHRHSNTVRSRSGSRSRQQGAAATTGEIRSRSGSRSRRDLTDDKDSTTMKLLDRVEDILSNDEDEGGKNNNN